MARRSLSLPGRSSRLSHVERKGSISLTRRKQVHWSNELEEVIYFPPDCSTLSTDGLFDRRVKLMRSKSLKTLYKSKRLPLKATQSLARGINDANSSLIRTGVNILTQQLDRFKSRSENLEIFDQESNNRWKELLRNYQKRMRDLLEEQEEERGWTAVLRKKIPARIARKHLAERELSRGTEYKRKDDPTGPGYCWSTETMRKAQIVEKGVHFRPSGRP
ncbi:unnamed protein product [Porites evermanni]|uniref:Uncharacterized protein n=1 Tax=Porites evermanni TaxID=104178 RepID=A0ABN8Q548_9CNID|nr:unnamed protein product [Porites evermanni]